MVSAKTLSSYLYWIIPFTVHTDSSDKQLGSVISQNQEPIELYSRRRINPHCNYTTTKNELLSIVECLKQMWGILFGYEINLFLDLKTLVYAVTLSESQRVIHRRIIIEEFGLNIQHIDGFYNIVADTLSILTSTSVEKYGCINKKDHGCANKLFVISRHENSEDCFPLNLLNVQR